MFFEKMSFYRLSQVSFLTVFLTFSAFVKAAGTKNDAHKSAGHSKISPEMKKDLADMYQKMADCMKTDKTIDECQAEVMKNCPVAKAMGHCPIMDGMKGMMSQESMDHSKMKR